MPEVIVLATLAPLPGHAAQVEAAFRSLLEPTHAEAGWLAIPAEVVTLEPLVGGDPVRGSLAAAG